MQPLEFVFSDYAVEDFEDFFDDEEGKLAIAWRKIDYDEKYEIRNKWSELLSQIAKNNSDFVAEKSLQAIENEFAATKHLSKAWKEMSESEKDVIRQEFREILDSAAQILDCRRKREEKRKQRHRKHLDSIT